MNVPFEWSLPYPSQREPVLARNIVATSQPLAAQVGLDILKRGGNAADAAVATAIAMTVLEPTTNGIGGDAFALVGVDGAVHGLNGSGRAPAAMKPDHFGTATAMPRRGWDAVTVPGAVSAWVTLSSRFGRLPFAELTRPAVELARGGFPVAPQTARLWARAAERLRTFEEWSRVFLVNGEPPRPGQIVRFPEHADTLEAIGGSGGADFYTGSLARRIADAARRDGGLLAADDLAAHTADWVEPISIDYRGWRLHEIPPNGQGIAALVALGLLSGIDLGSLQVDCPDVVHAQIEAMKLAFADVHAHVGDPGSMRIAPEDLLSDAYLAEQRARISPTEARDPGHGTPRYGGTILLVAGDADGMLVSFIQSNYEGWGSGIVVPGTGIALQNRGACFTLEPGHPNQVGPRKRPFHTIIPAMVSRNGRPVMAYGVMGGPMQPQGHVQVLSRIVDFKQNPQAALDAPRWQVQEGRTVLIEQGFPESVYDELRARGHEITVVPERTVRFGRGQVVLRLDDPADTNDTSSHCLLGASDLRSDGQAVGW